MFDLFAENIPNLMGPPRLDIRVKNHIDLFERPAYSLRIHEKHVEGHDYAKYTEDNISLPLNVVKGWCHEVGQGKVEDPVGGGRYAHALGSVLEWENLRGIDPCSGGLKMLDIVVWGQKLMAHTQVKP